MKNRVVELRISYLVKAFILSIVLCAYSVLTSLLLIVYLNISIGKQNNISSSKLQDFFLVVFIAPIIETILFQYLIINQVFISSNGNNKKLIAVLVSSFCFGIIHFFSFYYFLITFIGGLFLAYFFCYFAERVNTLSAIFYISLVHSLSNLYAFLIKIFDLL